ncbi:MAG TPA: hypothetical protein VNP97_02820 [Microbacterium sp.]|nr:hypothetical protein [Microbacterium sp.]
MDGPLTQPERTRELAVLRSRAYGPDADIHLDEGAVARLVELEELARRRGGASAAPRDPAVTASRIHPAESAAAADAPAAVAAPPGDPSAAAPAAHRPRSLRRIWVWGGMAAAALVGLTVGLVVPMMMTPQPQAVLRPIPLDGDPFNDPGFGFEPESVVRFELFHNLEAWSGETREGSVCVYVLRGADEMVGAGCGPEQLPPAADLTIYSGMPVIDGLDLPDGSVVRFSLRNGVIDVWIVPISEKA